MKQYVITYTDGSTETVPADYIEPGIGQYIVMREGAAAGWIPATGVRSIIRQDNTDA